MVCSFPCLPQLTNAQLGRVKSITGADFTDVLIRKDIQMGLCKIAGALAGRAGESGDAGARACAITVMRLLLWCLLAERL